jgi:hypothetical protein
VNLRDQLQAIYDEHGQLTPLLVLDEARPEDHPLHSRFEWDDSAAAESWRREQAHRLIRSVRVVYREASATERARDIRAFHALRAQDNDNGGFAYETAEAIAADPFKTKLLLQQMEREWQALRRRYAEFEEFWRLVNEARDESAA